MTFETGNATFVFKTFHVNKPCEKKPTCVSTRKNAYITHVGLPMNDHEFMTKRSKALTEPLLKTRTLLETIFHDFWCVLASKKKWVFLIFLTFGAQGPPRPSKTLPDLSQDPLRAHQGHQKVPQDGPRRLPKHPRTPARGQKCPRFPPDTPNFLYKTLPGPPRCLESLEHEHERHAKRRPTKTPLESATRKQLTAPMCFFRDQRPQHGPALLYRTGGDISEQSPPYMLG